MQTKSWMWQGAGFVFLGLMCYLLLPVLPPFLLAVLLAYITNPLVAYLVRAKMPRTAAVILIFCFLFLLAAICLFSLLPLLEKQVLLFFSALPGMLKWIQLTALPWVNTHFHLSLSFNLGDLKRTLLSHWQQAGSVAQSVWQTVRLSGWHLINGIVSFFVMLVVLFYLLRDWDHLLARLNAHLPKQHAKRIRIFCLESNAVLAAFFRGQLLIMLFLGLFYSAGLCLLGIRFGLLIGLLAGLLSIVPYLGTTSGVLAALLAAGFQYQDLAHPIYVLIVFGLGNVIEGMVLTPILMGDRMGLHPVGVIFAILAFGHLFGFMGVLLALPVAAVLMIVIKDILLQWCK